MSRLGRTCYPTCQMLLRVAGTIVIEHSATHRFTSVMCRVMSTATHVAKMWQEVSLAAGAVSSQFSSGFLAISVPRQFIVSV